MKISFIELLNSLISNGIADMHISIPAKILEYDHTLCKAKVQPSLNRKYSNGDILPLPVIHNVPIMQKRSSGAIIHFPVNIGDNVLLLFSERSLEEWLSSGEQLTPTDPRKNDLTDAIGFLGLDSFNNVSGAENNEDILIKYNESSIKIKPSGDIDIKATNVKIESETIDLKGDVKINDSLYDSHTHTGVIPGGGNSGPVNQI